MKNGAADIYGLRKSLIENDILICFNGPFSHSIIEEIGTAIRRYLESEDASRSSITDVFAVFVELTQNLQAYSNRFRGSKEAPGMDAGTLVIGRRGDRYVVSAGNPVERVDLPALETRLEALRLLDKPGLKVAYKERLHAPRVAGSGAGLGLIDVARRATEPLAYEIRDIDARFGFFSLSVII